MKYIYIVVQELRLAILTLYLQNTNSLSSHLQGLGNQLSTSVFMILTITSTLCEWNHSICLFWVWLILLSMMSSRFIHVLACETI